MRIIFLYMYIDIDKLCVSEFAIDVSSTNFVDNRRIVDTNETITGPPVNRIVDAFSLK